MEFWEKVLAIAVAPAAIVGAVAYLGRTIHVHVLELKKAAFQQSLAQQWQVRSSVQNALVSAYETLDDLDAEFTQLVDDNLLTERGKDARGIMKLAKLSRLEMFVDLWVPELDEPLSKLRESMRDRSREYHRLLVLMWQLDQALISSEEQGTTQPLANEQERILYQRAVGMIRRQEQDRLTTQLREQFPRIHAEIEVGGCIEFNQVSIEIIKS